MGFEPNQDERTMDNLPEKQFEGGGADIDGDGLSAASPVAAPRRTRLSVRSRAAADNSAPQSTNSPAVKGMPPRTEEHTPPPVRRPLMRPSSEFGYLFSDDEPVDNHMDDSYSRRLDGLAYEGRKDDEQYSSVMDGTQPSMVRRPENRMSADPAPSHSSREPQHTERSSRFSRRNRSVAAPEAAPLPEVIAEPPVFHSAPPEETAEFFAPPQDQRDFYEEDNYRPRRVVDEDAYEYGHRRHPAPEHLPDYGARQAAYSQYGQYPAPYPPGYPYPYGYPVPPQPGYPPYGYPVQPGYPSFAYPVQPQQGYPAYVYAVPTGMVYPAGMIPVQPIPAESPAVQPEQPAVEPAPVEKEEPTEKEASVQPVHTVSIQNIPVETRAKDPEPAPAAEKKAAEHPVEKKEADTPPASGTGNSRFNRRSRTKEDRPKEERPTVDFSNIPYDDSFDTPVETPAKKAADSSEKKSAPSGESFDWFSDHGGDTFGDGNSSSGGSSRFKRRSK